MQNNTLFYWLCHYLSAWHSKSSLLAWKNSSVSVFFWRYSCWLHLWKYLKETMLMFPSRWFAQRKIIDWWIWSSHMNCMNSLAGSIQQSQPRCTWSRARFGSQNSNLLMNFDCWIYCFFYCIICKCIVGIMKINIHYYLRICHWFTRSGMWLLVPLLEAYCIAFLLLTWLNLTLVHFVIYALTECWLYLVHSMKDGAPITNCPGVAVAEPLNLCSEAEQL